uniref:Spaetzle domain-containing protein n=2 Tax=Culex quinquefasciatus TaxID=7176 RepID=A0A1S4K5L4_CULQU
LVLITIIPVLTSGGYGYDSASSCDPNASRKGRSAQLLQSIPCDLSVQAYCNLPGSAYPWHAVRRFVHENQGLMRRMYGDVRHISILQAEIDNNDIDIEDIHRTAERYSRKKAGKKMKHVHSTQFEYVREKNNDVITEPHFRPTQKSSAFKSKLKTSSTTNPTIINANMESTTLSTIRPDFLNISQPTTEIGQEKKDQHKNSNTTTKVEGEKIDIEKLSTIANLETNIELVENVSTTTVKTIDYTIGVTGSSAIPVAKEAEEEINAQTSIDASTISTTTTDGEEKIQPQEHNIPEISTDKLDDKSNQIEQNKTEVNASKSPEGLLFQDAAQKDPPTINMRGVNACPVKEEVVAPFWANNTRGEVLALLNLYPFEQYVHWEKCSYEFKQMYCREGCRCEQQYRLHRLLAYDPHNECRGIFSDWFRFPSCCICKCYDLPYDFRVTSRSPRTIARETIQYAEDELQNAIYGHATDDWYRPKDDDHI